MMNCEQVAHAASDYLERKLGLGGRFAVWSHLLLCGACRVYVEQLRLARAALRGMKPSVEPEPQVDAVMAAFRQHVQSKHEHDEPK